MLLIYKFALAAFVYFAAYWSTQWLTEGVGRWNLYYTLPVLFMLLLFGAWNEGLLSRQRLQRFGKVLVPRLRHLLGRNPAVIRRH
jgi:hypothetical protein